MAAVIPEVVASPAPRDVLAIVTRAVFQAGVSWAQIANAWEHYETAFSQFDPAAVAAFDDLAVERVLSVPGVLRMRKKVDATVANARALLTLYERFPDLAAYAASFESYAALARDVRMRFAFLGEMSVWYVLFRCGLPVPRFESWIATIPGKHPRMREMVDLARAQGRSPERD
jgi:hypothetical protein